MSSTRPMTMGERLALAKLEERMVGTNPPQIVVGARYAVTALLGQRGIGESMRAHDRTLERDVALKCLPADLGRAWTGPRCADDVRALVQVRHDNVVGVLDVVEDPLGVFVVMQWHDGIGLREWLAARVRPWREVVDTMIAAARGLAAVHAAGLVHGDVTPDTVLVERDGSARIVDFGLAHRQRDGLQRATSGYLAPEQYAGEPATAQVDQLALCLTLFEALYSMRAIDTKLADRLRVDPFAWSLPERPRQAGVPRRIDAVIARGTARERSARYPTMDALIDALVDARGRGPSRALATAGVAAVLCATIAAIRCGVQ